MDSKDAEDLEKLIDKYSFIEILDVMGAIAYEKAEHIRVNWQDRSSAKLFDKVGDKIGKLVDMIHSHIAKEI